MEQALARDGAPFIANDCKLDGAGERAPGFFVVTGPNMAGKSTYLRQNALIAVLAQMGSYVPAASAHIGVADRLFARIGAADDLARGRSTFMVEMTETAAILNRASDKSLVILDEIGRGTATFDGLSIAWAVLEHLHDAMRCRGLVATHYHELTRLADKPAARGQCAHGRDRVEGRDRVPACGRGGRGEPLLRRAGGEARGRAEAGACAREADSGAARKRGRAAWPADACRPTCRCFPRR